jgi:hypothetical protein
LWPARIPNHVITQSSYDVVVNPLTNAATRLSAFTRRTQWQPNTNGIPFGLHVNEIVADPASLGLIIASPGPGTPDVPARIYVEYRRKPR